MPSRAKQVARRVRAAATWWVAPQSPEHLESIRIAELDLVLRLLPGGGRLLELGAGSGWQARKLASAGYEVTALDVPSSGYRANRVWDVIEYDGRHIPFDDGSFDIVFSSNVLEHVPHLAEFQREIQRVLRPGGVSIHVVPSGTWRLWTSFTQVVRHWCVPNLHGEHAANVVTEIYHFSRLRWLRLFREAGWRQVTRIPNRLFYTGFSIMDIRLPTAARRRLSRLLGSTCHVFVMRPPADPAG